MTIHPFLRNVFLSATIRAKSVAGDKFFKVMHLVNKIDLNEYKMICIFYDIILIFLAHLVKLFIKSNLNISKSIVFVSNIICQLKFLKIITTKLCHCFIAPRFISLIVGLV